MYLQYVQGVRMLQLSFRVVVVWRALNCGWFSTFQKNHIVLHAYIKMYTKTTYTSSLSTVVLTMYIHDNNANCHAQCMYISAWQMWNTICETAAYSAHLQSVLQEQASERQKPLISPTVSLTPAPRHVKTSPYHPQLLNTASLIGLSLPVYWRPQTPYLEAVRPQLPPSPS